MYPFDILYDFNDQNDTSKRSMKEVIHGLHFSDQLDTLNPFFFSILNGYYD